MMDYSDIVNIPPYSLCSVEKRRLLTERLMALSKAHYGACASYQRMVDALGCNLEQVADYYGLPFLPVSLFKELDLLSVDKKRSFQNHAFFRYDGPSRLKDLPGQGYCRQSAENIGKDSIKFYWFCPYADAYYRQPICC